MTFSYTKDIPNAPNNPSKDQPNMKVNTNSTNDLIAVDHFSFNVANGGKHEQVQLPVRIGSDFPAIIGQGTAYSKAIGFGNDAQLFWRFANGGLSPLQITGNQYLAASNGYVPLMNAMLLQWGRVTGLSGGWPTTPQVLTYASSGNVAFQNNTFAVFTTFIGPTSSSSGDITINSFTNTQFIWQFSGSSSASFGGFYWVAIGN